MEADDAGHALLDRRIDRGERGGDLRRRVADQRRQEGGGAKARVRGADRRYGIDIDLIVEQYAAAAVDLRVDEAGQQPAAPQVDLALGGRIAGIRDRSENAVDQDRKSTRLNSSHSCASRMPSSA